MYPWFKPRGHKLDTLVLSNFLYSDMRSDDALHRKRMEKRGREWIPKNLTGRHSLEAWGYRLGEWKGDYAEMMVEEGLKLGISTKKKSVEMMNFVWGTWRPSMQSYCEQDVEVTEKLYLKLHQKLIEMGLDPYDFHPKPGKDVIRLEHQVAEIIFRQERHGFLFDEEAAAKLYAHLIDRKTKLEDELQETFPPWFRNKGIVKPKASRSVKMTEFPDITVRRFGKNGKELKPYVGPPKCHYTEAGRRHLVTLPGKPTPVPVSEGSYTKVELEPFNPGSRDDVADRLIKLRGWRPIEFTNDGKPQVSEEVLNSLPYPEAKLLSEYFMVSKRLGQLSEGAKAWLKNVRPDGRISAGANTNGAVTGRMTHYGVANVPGVYDKKTGELLPYGREIRQLFIAPKGKVIVGCDADALELVCLAGFMAHYDGGAYIETVLNGDKSKGTDMHTVNGKALGIIREAAKTWFYAFIYGAGVFTLGVNAGATGSKNAITKRGEETKASFLKNLPALKKLIDAVQKKGKSQGWIRGLDGRRIPIRSLHAALNSLLQSAGAVFMKRALVLLDTKLQSLGLVPGDDYEFVANIHDEFQIEAKEEHAKEIGKHAEWAIAEAGRFYNFRCPLSGSSDIGLNWAETH